MKKFIIKNAMALVALAIATVTLMSFGLSVNSTEQENQYWFEMDGNTPTHVIPAPDPECPQLVTKDCARLYNESQTEGTGTERQVKEEEIDNPVSHRSLKPSN